MLVRVDLSLFTSIVLSIINILKCNNTRYVRIDAPSGFLQISQVAVFESKTMKNVALKKQAQCSAPISKELCTYSCSNAVDGILAVKNFHNCSNLAYHSAG